MKIFKIFSKLFLFIRAINHSIPMKKFFRKISNKNGPFHFFNPGWWEGWIFPPPAQNSSDKNDLLIFYFFFLKQSLGHLFDGENSCRWKIYPTGLFWFPTFKILIKILISASSPIVIRISAQCSLCNEVLLQRPIIAFTCRHFFHRDCLESRVKVNCTSNSLPFYENIPLRKLRANMKGYKMMKMR